MKKREGRWWSTKRKVERERQGWKHICLLRNATADFKLRSERGPPSTFSLSLSLVQSEMRTKSKFRGISTYVAAGATAPIEIAARPDHTETTSPSLGRDSGVLRAHDQVVRQGNCR
jgi:hypothetical protein